MTILENPILLPWLRLLVGMCIGKDNLRLYDTVDWQQACDRFVSANFDYPEYYRSQDFHGIPGGYLNPIAPVTYDAVTRFAAPPNEIKLRKKAILQGRPCANTQVKSKPQKILDLGCGTGSSTIMLKQAYPQARTIGLDISPYMLTVAEHNANKANLSIDWQQGLAEATVFPQEAFDLISIAFLFHETPVNISCQILEECWRLLKFGGQIIILDGHQLRLRRTRWLIELFREPYSQAYAAENIDLWLADAGFIDIHTKAVGWISQLSVAFKPKSQYQ